MSGVYENVFEKSEIFLLLSLRDRLLFTICVRIPCITSACVENQMACLDKRRSQKFNRRLGYKWMLYISVYIKTSYSKNPVEMS